MTSDRVFFLQAALLCAGLAAWFSWLLTPAVRRLASDLNVVRDGFARFGLLDDQVRFLQGRPVDTLTAGLRR